MESAGAERTQAEAIAGATQQRQFYASRSDVARLCRALQAEMGQFRSELRADMAALEMRLTNLLYAVAIGLAALIAAFGVFT